MRSVLYYRISSLGPAHMPRIGSRVISEAALNLVYDWIKQMPNPPATNEPAAVAAAKVEEANRNLLGELCAGKTSAI